MLAPVGECEPGADGELSRRRADEHFVRLGSGRHARGDVQGDSARRSADAYDLPRMYARADRKAQSRRLIARAERRRHRGRRRVEERQEAVAGRVDLLAAEAEELFAQGAVVGGEKVGPRDVAEPRRRLGGADDVRDEDAREEAEVALAAGPDLGVPDHSKRAQVGAVAGHAFETEPAGCEPGDLGSDQNIRVIAAGSEPRRTVDRVALGDVDPPRPPSHGLSPG